MSDAVLDALSKGCEESGAALTAECVDGMWAACAVINEAPHPKVGLGITLASALLDLCGHLGWKVEA